MVEVDVQGRVAVLSMGHGKVNAFDVEFLAELAEALRGIESSSAGAILLTSSRHVFSAGVDLFRVLDGDERYAAALVAHLHETLRGWFATRLPVVAAVNGSAIAGGCVLAAATDLRLIADGPCVIGVPELTVGVPYPAVALEIMRYVCGRDAGRVVLSGRLHPPGEALGVGLVHEVVPEAELMDRALAAAAALAELPAEATALAKSHLRGPSLRWIDERLGSDADVARMWGQPETHTRIRQSLHKTVGSRSR